MNWIYRIYMKYFHIRKSLIGAINVRLNRIIPKMAKNEITRTFLVFDSPEIGPIDALRRIRIVFSVSNSAAFSFSFSKISFKALFWKSFSSSSLHSFVCLIRTLKSFLSASRWVLKNAKNDIPKNSSKKNRKKIFFFERIRYIMTSKISFT